MRTSSDHFTVLIAPTDRRRHAPTRSERVNEGPGAEKPSPPAPDRPADDRANRLMNQLQPVETARLILRRWSDDDLSGLRELTHNAEVMRHIGARVTLTEKQTLQEHAAKLAHWHEHGFGAWAAACRDTNEWIGYAVLQHPRPDVVELHPSEVEIGWLLLPFAWGQGYATEAAER